MTGNSAGFPDNMAVAGGKPSLVGNIFGLIDIARPERAGIRLLDGNDIKIFQEFCNPVEILQ